jgi:transposase
MTIPGVGPIIATAVTALVPAAQNFPAGRTIRRLLVIGASAVVHQASRRGAPKGSWLAQMLARKPKMLVTVVLANKMARIVSAVLVKGGVYQAPVVAA